MIDFIRKSQYDFQDLVRLVALLRGEGGCAWDRAQTHASIRRNLLEEAYEACEAIDDHDPAHLKEELGDVLLQVLFHAGIEQDAGRFSINEVCDGVCRKLLFRHPHLFEGGQPIDWEQLKRKERGQQTVLQSMADISKALPALWRADKLLDRAEKSGLYPNDLSAAVAQLQQEITDLNAAASAGAPVFDTLGSALFALVRVAGGCGIDAEEALNSACKSFTDGFLRIEEKAAQKD